MAVDVDPGVAQQGALESTFCHRRTLAGGFFRNVQPRRLHL